MDNDLWTSSPQAFVRYINKGGTYLFLQIILHPLPEATYTGVRRTPLGNMFFPSFLAKTKREQLLPDHIHGKFWPHSLQFAL